MPIPKPYHDNTVSHVFTIANVAKSIAEQTGNSKGSIPVIVIDGPAGTGKTTFTHDLLAALQELGVETTYFEQDSFGINRAARDLAQISACSDFARDPATAEQLTLATTQQTWQKPEYDRRTGTRGALPSKNLERGLGAIGQGFTQNNNNNNDSKAPGLTTMPAAHRGSVIVYEGVSSLSGVAYDNPNLTDAQRDALRSTMPIRIFCRPENEDVLYASRKKRDVEERKADPQKFERDWNVFQRNNHLYTYRGRANCNFELVRKADDSFQLAQVAPVEFEGKTYPVQPSEMLIHGAQNTEEATIKTDDLQPLSSSDLRRYRRQVMQERHDILHQNYQSWFVDHFKNMREKFHEVSPDAIQFDGETIELQKKSYETDDALDMRTRPKAELVGEHKTHALDDMDLARTNKDRERTKRYDRLIHDKDFNNKRKLTAEIAFSAIGLNNLDTIMPHIIPVSNHIKNKLADLFQKVLIDKTANATELKVFKFFIEPFKAGSNELGRMPMNADGSAPSDEEVGKWLMEQMGSPKPETFFTQMRAHIRYSHFMSEELPTYKQNEFQELTGSLSDHLQKDMEHCRSLRAKLFVDEMFAGTRGRKPRVHGKGPALSTGIGAMQDSRDSAPVFNQYMYNPNVRHKEPLQTQPHAGVRMNRATSQSPYNKAATAHDQPLSQSASGAMMHLLVSAQDAQVSGEELKEYQLGALTHLIAGGFHTMTECLGVSQSIVPMQGTSYQDIIPERLQKEGDYKDFIELVNDEDLSGDLFVRSEEAKQQAKPKA